MLILLHALRCIHEDDFNSCGFPGDAQTAFKDYSHYTPLTTYRLSEQFIAEITRKDYSLYLYLLGVGVVVNLLKGFSHDHWCGNCSLEGPRWFCQGIEQGTKNWQDFLFRQLPFIPDRKLRICWKSSNLTSRWFYERSWADFGGVREHWSNMVSGPGFRPFFSDLLLRTRKRYSKNLPSQVFGAVRVNFLEWVLTKTLYFVRGMPELFRQLLGSLRMILCYWKTFPVLNYCFGLTSTWSWETGSCEPGI